MGDNCISSSQRPRSPFRAIRMAKCALLFLALMLVSSSSFLRVEATPAPEAESDPRNYVLFPMEGLVEDNEDDHAPEETVAPEFRSAESLSYRPIPRWPFPRRRPFPRWRSSIQESEAPEVRTLCDLCPACCQQMESTEDKDPELRTAYRPRPNHYPRNHPRQRPYIR